MSDEQIKLQPVGLGRILAKGFRNTYDSLGYIVFATFVSFVAASALFTPAALISGALHPGMGGIVMFLPAAFVAYLGAVGVFYYTNKLIFGEHPILKDTLTGIRVLFLPALKLFIMDAVITAVLLGDSIFFLEKSAAKGGSLYAVLGILCGYLTLVWLMMAMYHLPLLVAQLNMESGPKPGVILRKSFLLTADNPSFTVGLFLVIIALAVLCVLPAGAGMALLYLGVTAFLLTTAIRELFVKYGIVEEEPEVVEDKWRLPTSWLKREEQDTTSDPELGGKTDG